ncbi:MAG: ATP synthase F0 subunit C [Actinomycetes bacterium]
MASTTLSGNLTPVTFGLAAIGSGIGAGLVFAAFITGIARQPEALSVLRTWAFTAFALIEALALIALVAPFFLK